MNETLKILVVDDEECILDIFKSYFEFETNHELFTASDGFEAFEIIKTEPINCCFTDLLMPKLNGFDVCHIVKNELRFDDIHIIMLTAKGQEFDKQRGQEVGADTYMTKPFDPDDLLAKAEEVLGL